MEGLTIESFLNAQTFAMAIAVYLLIEFKKAINLLNDGLKQNTAILALLVVSYNEHGEAKPEIKKELMVETGKILNGGQGNVDLVKEKVQI